MFSLSDADLKQRILGCADGPASFNAEMYQRDRRVVSCDPLYQFKAEEIRRRIESTWPRMLEFARRNHTEFVWDTNRSSKELVRLRRATMERFLADFEAGKAQGRYLVAALPSLPFADQTFELALCSHFLFLYSEQFPLQFHIDSVREMARVAREVRVFPLLDHVGKPSCHLEPVTAAAARWGLKAEVEQVPYEFQRGGNRMLRLMED
jgi:hypothetical protein